MSAAGTEPAGRLAGRIALVTGASRGIGRAVALRFAKEGAQLIIVARTQGGLEEIDDEIRADGHHPASLVPADLTEEGVIDHIAQAINARWGRLDILVGNAGTLGTLSPLPHIDPAAWDDVLAINLGVNFRLIRALDPLLRASDAGRAIFPSSGVAQGRAYWGAYAVSRGALETMVRTYAHEMANTTVRANLINPGGTRTRMRAQAYPGEDPASLKPADDPSLMDAFVSLAEAACNANGTIVTIEGPRPC